jgi:hypothetical protein
MDLLSPQYNTLPLAGRTAGFKRSKENVALMSHSLYVYISTEELSIKDKLKDLNKNDLLLIGKFNSLKEAIVNLRTTHAYISKCLDNNLPFRDFYYLYKTLIVPIDKIEDLSMPSKELYSNLYKASRLVNGKEVFVYLQENNTKLIGKFNSIGQACSILKTDYKMIMFSLDNAGSFRSKYFFSFSDSLDKFRDSTLNIDIPSKLEYPDLFIKSGKTIARSVIVKNIEDNTSEIFSTKVKAAKALRIGKTTLDLYLETGNIFNGKFIVSYI